MSFLRWFWVVMCAFGTLFAFLNILEGDVEQPVWLSSIMFASMLTGGIGAILKNRYLVWAPAVGLFARFFVIATATTMPFLFGTIIGSLIPITIMMLLSMGFSGRMKF